MRLAINATKGKYLEILDTGKTSLLLRLLVDNYRPKNNFLLEKGYVSWLKYTTACINIKRFLFTQTLLPHIIARITCFFLSGFQRDLMHFLHRGIVLVAVVDTNNWT